MTVVSDSSPLITLAKIGLLELLPRLYARISITPQVYREVVVDGAGLAGSAEIAVSNWIDVRAIGRPEDLAGLQDGFGIGAGEASAIILAVDVLADLVLIDEIRARRAARSRGFAVLGCVGVLEDAYGSGLLTDLRHAYQSVLASGAYIDHKILEDSLRTLGLPSL